MSSFLNVRSSGSEVSCKRDFLKIKTVQNLFKKIHDEAFNSIKLRGKILQLYSKETLAYIIS